jgi:hypothetical protein
MTVKRFRCPKGFIQKPPKSRKCISKTTSKTTTRKKKPTQAKQSKFGKEIVNETFKKKLKTFFLKNENTTKTQLQKMSSSNCCENMLWEIVEIYISIPKKKGGDYVIHSVTLHHKENNKVIHSALLLLNKKTKKTIVEMYDFVNNHPTKTATYMSLKEAHINQLTHDIDNIDFVLNDDDDDDDDDDEVNDDDDVDKQKVIDDLFNNYWSGVGDSLFHPKNEKRRGGKEEGEMD